MPGRAEFLRVARPSMQGVQGILVTRVQHECWDGTVEVSRSYRSVASNPHGTITIMTWH